MRSSRFFLASGLLAVLAVMGCATSGRDLSVLGFVPQQRVRRLLLDVQKRFGKPIRFEWVELFDPDDRLGESDVSLDGSPVIRLRTRVPASAALPLEDTVVHELFHLQLIAEGFPAVDLRLHESDHERRSAPAHLRDAAFSDVRTQLWDPILHFIFFPRVFNIGLDPGRLRRRSVRARVRSDSTRGLQDSYHRAQYVYQSALELGEGSVMAELESWYERHGWGEDLALGKKMASIVTSTGSRDADGALLALARVIEVVNGGRVKVEPPTLSEVWRGSARIRVARMPVRFGG